MIAAGLMTARAALTKIALRAEVNRDHARAALSVMRVAQHREDLDEVDVMACAIRCYLNLVARDEEDRAAADRRRFYRPGDSR